MCYNIEQIQDESCVMPFSEKVKYVRKKLYLSQVTLAKELGVSFATVTI